MNDVMAKHKQEASGHWFSEARNMYIKLCQFDKQNIRMWYQRGMFEIQRILPDAAQSCFERGLDCPWQSDNPRCWHGIGRC